MHRRLLALVALLMLVLVAPLAHAGSFRLNSTEAQEVSGGWRLRMRIELNAPPSLAHVPSGCAFHPRCPHATLPLCSEKEPPLRVISGDPEGDPRALHTSVCHLLTAPQAGEEALP